MGGDFACGARAFCALGGADILSAVCSLEFRRQDVARTVADRISALRLAGRVGALSKSKQAL